MQTGHLETETLLMCLLPGLGPRAALGPLRAELKWAGPGSLAVEKSAVEFLDSAGRALERHEDAFGLTPGTELHPPYSHRLTEDVAFPSAAAWTCWHLNHWTVKAPVAEPETVWRVLSFVCLSLELPLAEDTHLIAGVVNTGEKPIDIAQGVREAVFYVDRVPWPSTAGRVWNGPYLVRPQHTAFCHFRLADFPGAPVAGVHEVALEMLGLRSSPQIVRWHGEPWLQRDSEPDGIH